MALNQPDVAQTIACNTNKEYRVANHKCEPNKQDFSSVPYDIRHAKWEANNKSIRMGAGELYDSSHFQ